MATLSKNLLIEGSSSSAVDGGIGSAPYHMIYMADMLAVNRPMSYANFASDGGAILDTIIARTADVIAKFSAAPVLNILTLQLGQNDFVDGAKYANNLAGWLPAVEALLATYRAGAGGKLLTIGLTTQNPRKDPAFLGTRAAVNVAIRGLVTNRDADFIIDWAADPTYGQDAAVGDITKYPDGTHPSQVNQNNMEALYYRPALDVL